jgi:hypothetical protein
VPFLAPLIGAFAVVVGLSLIVFAFRLQEKVDGTGCSTSRRADASAAELPNHGAHAARRSFVQDRLGMKEDFTSREQPVETTATSPAASEPEYAGELERLAQLRDQGILSDEEFEAKKQQILGI